MWIKMLSHLILTYPWTRYSKKLQAKIENPRSAGFFSKEESEARRMHLAIGKEGKIEDGNMVYLFWLVDPEDGGIVDAKFQAYGQSALIGAAEAACELLIGKNYDQAKRIGADLIDKQLRDRADISAFPKETAFHLNLVLGAIENAAEQCVGLPLPSNYVAPPVPIDIGEVREGGYPGWIQLSVPQKISVIEEVLSQDVRPYIELDAGGVIVKNLLNDCEVIIAYQGSCTTCFSATGTTLSYIQQILRAKVNPELVVVPYFGYVRRKPKRTKTTQRETRSARRMKRKIKRPAEGGLEFGVLY
jgi:NifU-like protein